LCKEKKFEGEIVFRHIGLNKGIGYGFRYTYYQRTDVLHLYIPEERLNEYDFEFGLTHELTEAFLRKLLARLENYTVSDCDEKIETFHNVATLSGERYDFIAHYYDYLEDQLANASLREEVK
jgi:CRP-like cAMP-binding protein